MFVLVYKGSVNLRAGYSYEPIAEELKCKAYSGVEGALLSNSAYKYLQQCNSICGAGHDTLTLTQEPIVKLVKIWP